MKQKNTIAIIGGGLSGSLLLLYLLEELKFPTNIFLFEKDPSKLFKGVAYSSALPYQLLNVPVKGMSLYETEPFHFHSWLTDNQVHCQADDFVSRELFGKYLHETLSNSIQNSTEHRVTIINKNVSALDISDDKKSIVYSEDDQPLVADKVFLCTGNFPPGEFGPLKNILNHPAYKTDPWSGEYIKQVRENDKVLIIGTGLTMIDQVLSLFSDAKFKGHITAISRRGFLPLSHAGIKHWTFSFVPDFKEIKLAGLVKWLRKEISSARKQEINWQSVIEALRPYNQQIWASFNLQERRSFLAHLRPFWDIHRHRIPVESSKKINQFMNEGRLSVVRGRITQAKPLANDRVLIEYQSSNRNTSLEVNHVINCSGPQSDFRKIDSPLFLDILSKGLCKQDELGLGLNVNENGYLINDKGEEIHNIRIIGPPAKGTLWECIALREIRVMAKSAVRTLLLEKAVK